jgi:hypothetical protein
MNDTSESSTARAPGVEHEGPYIGLRPYEERDRELFFGRDSEGTLLVNKILTNPVTLVFAASGIGKSSLLRTLVVPALRKLETRVVYFDEWTLEPVAGLRSAVAKGLGFDGAPEKTLLELARDLTSKGDDSLVLILDQFEQFFLRHGDPKSIERVAQELAALARTGADAHIVLVLREEFVGRLDAFRDHWLTLSPARYRVAPLAGKAAEEAIERPLERFSGSIDDALVHELLRALALGTSASGINDGMATEQGTSLPILQIVCRGLWQAVQSEPSPHLSLTLYHDLDGRQGIVDRYVREAFETAAAGERYNLARVLNALAPKAGVKMAYPVDVLSDQVKLDSVEVLKLLARLEQQRIVHFREEGRVVELTHDAFTEVLRTFIEDELRKERERIEQEERREREYRAAEAAQAQRKRRRNLIVGSLLLALLAMLGGMTYRYRQELVAQRASLRKALGAKDCAKLTSALRDLRAHAEPGASVSEQVMSCFLSSPLEELLTGLENNADVAAGCNAPRQPASELGTSQSASSITLAYRERDEPGVARRSVQTGSIRQLWQHLSDRLWQEKRIRLPSSIDVVFDGALPAGSFVLKLDQRVMVRRSVAPVARKLAVLAWNSPRSFDDEVKVVGKGVDFEHQPLKALDPRRLSMGLAETWSAPLWRVIEERLAPKVSAAAEPISIQVLPAVEAVMTLEAFESMAQSPELYVTEPLTQRLLALRQEDEPCLVRASLERFLDCPEAERGRDGSATSCQKEAVHRLTSRVHLALLEAARRGRPAGMVTRILDRIADLEANDPEARPDRIVDWLIDDDGRGRPPTGIRLSGARDWACPRDPLFEAQQYTETAPTLDAEEKPIRVRLGAELVKRLSRDSALVPAFRDRLAELRLSLYRVHGVSPPGVRFAQEWWGDDRFQIDLLGMAKPATGHADGDEPVVGALETQLLAARSATIGVNTWPLRQELSEWLPAHFSRNDLKLLMRAVLVNDASQTIRDLPWLLASLPIWTEVCGQQNSACLVEHLVEAEAARTRPRGAAPPATASLSQTIDALLSDHPERAVTAFRGALKEDRAGSIRAFLASYAPVADDLILRYVERELCEVPVLGLSDDWRVLSSSELSEVKLALERPPAARNVARSANLRLCALMADLPSGDATFDLRRVLAFLSHHAVDRKSFSVDQGFWLAERLLQASVGPGTPDPERPRLLAEAQEHVASLLAPVFASPPPPLGSPDAAFKQLQKHCESSKNDRCYWSLTEIAEKAELDANTFWELARALGALPTNGTTARLAQVRRIWGRALERLPARLGPAQKARYAVTLDIFRYGVDVDLLAHGIGNVQDVLRELDDARTRLEKVTGMPESERVNLRRNLLFFQRDALDYAGQNGEANAVASALQRSARAEQALELVPIQIREGRVGEAAATADDALERQIGDQQSTLFSSALAHLLLNDAAYAESARRLLFWMDHPYRDYVRLMLAWRLLSRGAAGENEARALLQDRLREVPAGDNPEQRLAEGDLNPWHEIIVRYYLNQTPETSAKVFDSLKDQKTFAQSMLSRGSQSLASFRCEAYFYDALLQSVSGEARTRAARYRNRLQQVVDEKCYTTYEYAMASYLLRSEKTP